MPATSASPFTRSRRGFTLVELLVVIGIIALLISILLPSLNRARQAAKDVQCASNLRQLSTTMVHYSIDNDGRFPTNLGTQRNSDGFQMFWYDEEQIGEYIPAEVKVVSGSIGGHVLICPSDVENSMRSYAANVWAASDLEKFVDIPGNGWFNGVTSTGLQKGMQFNSNVSNASSMILLGEEHAGSPYQGNLYANASLGWSGNTPGERFVKINPPLTGPYGSVPTELDYSRHRTSDNPSGNYFEGQAFGRANFAFADGHVAMKSVEELARRETLISTREAMWSPLDDELVEWEAQNPASNGTR